MLLRTKGVRAEMGASIKISYDPKRPHQVFIADEHPQLEHLTGVAISAAIGSLIVLAGVVSRIA